MSPDASAAHRARAARTTGGYEGLAISPDGKRLYAILQDPLLNEGPRQHRPDTTDNDGRDGRNVRIVVFDNDWWSPTYRQSIAQYAYQLEPQPTIINRIVAAGGGTVAPGDHRQGRNIGLSAIVALNDHQFLVIERDNRGIGVDNPVGSGAGVGPFPLARRRRQQAGYKIDIDGATDIIDACHFPTTAIWLRAGIDAGAEKRQRSVHRFRCQHAPAEREPAEKWEGLTIGPRLLPAGALILAGNDNDYSVTQTGIGEQFDVYVDFRQLRPMCP